MLSWSFHFLITWQLVQRHGGVQVQPQRVAQLQRGVHVVLRHEREQTLRELLRAWYPCTWKHVIQSVAKVVY